MNIINYHNINIEDDVCIICQENLINEECFTLKECKHKYHTNCIISWFRNGDSRCPLCGDKGIGYINNKENYRYLSMRNQQMLIDIRYYINRKSNLKNELCIKLRKKYEKLNELEEQLQTTKSEYNNYIRNLKNKLINYNEANNQINTFINKIKKTKWLIITKKLIIINNSYIIPLIIPKYI